VEEILSLQLSGEPANGHFVARFDALALLTEQLNGYELGYRRLFGKAFSGRHRSYYNHTRSFRRGIRRAIISRIEQPGVSTAAPANYLLPRSSAMDCWLH